MKSGLQKELERLLAHNNVAVVVTEVHNPFNRDSVFFKGPVGGNCALVQCYNRTESAVHQLNGAFINLWVELGRPDRLQIAALHARFHNHESPRSSCGNQTPDVWDSWIQQKDDEFSNSKPGLDENLGPKGPWLGDCFHPNILGATQYALAVNEDAQRMNR